MIWIKMQAVSLPYNHFLYNLKFQLNAYGYYTVVSFMQINQRYKKSTMDRKDFFKESFKCLIGKGLEIFSDNPVISYLEKSALEKERPPGAITPDSNFQKLCTGCDACMIACPVNIIFIEDQTTRYPVIYPETSPCLHCTGYPCITACPTSALTLK